MIFMTMTSQADKDQPQKESLSGFGLQRQDLGEELELDSPFSNSRV